jgi:phosphopantothenate synthetase
MGQTVRLVSTLNESGDSVQSIFLEGLKSAREIVQNKGIQHLDSLIEELEEGSIETTALAPKMEIR